jgi:predicted ATP-grasp superfamily ATP-dependent carboligase
MDLKERITAWVDAHQAEYFDDLSKLIAVDSAKGEALEGKPFGQGCADVLALGQDILKSHGFDSENDDNYVITADLNDKETVHQRAVELGLPVPEEFAAVPDRYPVVIKPHCGEKVGLKARERYVIAENTADYMAKYSAMARYDADPIVQEKVVGPGEGVNLLLDEQSRLICAFCPRRLREYPASGGPSTCCVSFYDAGMIDQAYRLLASFGFVGMAMVEFKGDCLLEVNPRVWGSFPMTEAAQSPFTAYYARAAAGERVRYTAQDYRSGVRMRFLLNDTLAALHYLRAGRIGVFLRSIADLFTAKEALRCRGDNRVFWVYLKNSLFARG